MSKIKILVPTDFSLCAENALNYAFNLAKDLNAEILIMHSIIYDDSLFPDSNEEENTLKYNHAKEKLDIILKNLKNKNPEIVSDIYLEGDSVKENINAIIKTKNINYVVMGTEGASGFKGFIFGSFTSEIISTAICPVLAIPAMASYKGLKHIVCATEMHESEIPVIKKVLELTSAFNSKLTFYNVNQNEEEQRVRFFVFEKTINKLNSSPLIDFVTILSNDTIGSIEQFIADENPELLITLGKERSIVSKILGKSLTKKLSLHTKIPLLSFPSSYFQV